LAVLTLEVPKETKPSSCTTAVVIDDVVAAVSQIAFTTIPSFRLAGGWILTSVIISVNSPFSDLSVNEDMSILNRI
jgi:hypothetical protein